MNNRIVIKAVVYAIYIWQAAVLFIVQILPSEFWISILFGINLIVLLFSDFIKMSIG